MFFEIKKEEGEKIYTLFGKKIFRRRSLLRPMSRKMALMEVTLARMEDTLTRMERKIDCLELSNEQLMSLLRCTVAPGLLPPAQGWLRDMQMVILKIIREIDRICTNEGIPYWLDSGSTLGAVRHGGFIPWDDDADLGMMRHDLKRFLDVFPRVASPELRIRYYNDRVWNLVKIEHSRMPEVFVDIFAYDFYNGAWESWEERKELTQLSFVMRDNCTPPDSYEEKLAFFADMSQRLMKEHPAPPSDKPDIFLGLEFKSAYASSIFFPYDAILPTKRMKFEGVELCVPHDTHVYLSYYYGDYMTLPRSLAHHGILSELNVPMSLALKEYALDKQPEN